MLMHSRFRSKEREEQTVRLEENLLVTKDGPIVFTKHPFEAEALA